MRRTELLLALLAVLIVTSAVTANLPATTAQAASTMAVSPLVIDIRNLKEPGDTFSVNITIANVKALWGYEFVLRYNASIVTATAYDTPDSRFTRELPSEIGDNYTTVAQGTYDGDLTGITTTAPIVVAKIDFVVTGSGTTILFLDPPFAQLAGIHGEVIPCVPVDGRFSNTETLATHDVGITVATPSTTSATVGDKIDITVTVANLGDFAENVTVGAKYNQSQTNFQKIADPQSITNLAAGTDNQVTFTWDTANVAAGLYEVVVQGNVTVDNKSSDNTYTTNLITLNSKGGGGIPMQYIYIGVGVAIIAIAGIAVYALRARKPEQ